MIRSFRDPRARDLFEGGRGRPVWQSFRRIARRTLLLLDAANNLTDPTVPPGNRLEPLEGRRRGQHSIRVNDQYRVCFVWTGADADQVEIIDTHDE